jgi:VIT1/CCC1 family predicted Fe2+/Mn2+ transporter
MKHSLNKGISFGLTSGIITTLGLIMGLHSGTHSKPVIMGGILIIAIADAFSDALGIHISEESENKHADKEIWEATIATFFSKFIFASTFIIPILLFELSTAIIVAVIWGLSLLSLFSYFIAKAQNATPWKVILEHFIIGTLVILITHFIGDWIGIIFD